MKETKFKDTEVGRIPEDWQLDRLKENFEFKANNTLSRDALSESGIIQDVHYGDVLIKYGSYLDVHKDSVPYISDSGFKASSFISDGDVIIADTAEDETVGKATEVINVGSNKLVSGLHTMWLHPIKQEKYALGYLGYAFNASIYHNQLLPLMQGTKVISVSKSAIKDTYIVHPSKSEQSRIATTLSTIDNLISELGKLIEKKRAIKQGAMQQLLTGKKRLKGFNEPWVEKTICDCFEVYDGTHQTPYYVENGIPFYSVENVTANDFKHTKYISEEEHKLLTAKYRMRKGDVLMTRIGSIGVCKYIDWNVNASYYVSLALLKPKCNIHAPFFCFASTSKVFKDDIKLRSLLFAIPLKINLNEIAKVKFLCPQNITEQQAIASVLTFMDKEISAIEAKKAKYETIKQGMMQQLLTGKIRLVETAVKPNATSANVHFRRSVWAAEIAERLYEEPTFGHVKMEKMLFLTERLCHIDIGSHYHRDAAGPYDNNALRSIDSQLKKQKWFEVQRTEKGYRYVPMQNRGKHKTYFNRYYSGVVPMFDKIINTFKTQNTERCEIVATLYSAWEDLLHSNKSFTDADIVNEILNNWHESKKRISQDRWLKAIQWMRDNGFAPDMLS